MLDKNFLLCYNSFMKVSKGGDVLTHSEETKTKISARTKGRTLSDEHKAKISTKTKGLTPWNKKPITKEILVKEYQKKVDQANKAFLKYQRLEAIGESLRKQFLIDTGNDLYIENDGIKIAREMGLLDRERDYSGSKAAVRQRKYREKKKEAVWQHLILT